MGEARRRKLAKSQWDDPAKRSSLIALAHNAMGQSDDPTLSGMTVIFPSGETIFLSAADAKKIPTPDA